MNIIERIEHIAAEMPTKPAFISRFGEITYGELWDASGKLAAWIDKTQGDNKKPVIVYGHKSPWMPVCFLAAVRSGRAYCPVDSSMPEERVLQIIDKVGNPLVLSTEPLEPENAHLIEELKEIVKNRETISKDKWISGKDLFYVIFTSGSTGLPKGVKITMDNLEGFTQWSRSLGRELEEEERIFLNQAPLSFDLSVMDIYTGLTSGSTICSIDKELQQDNTEMLDYIKENNVSFWVSTPSFADLAMTAPEFNDRNFPCIKNFFFCGEKLTVSTAKELRRRFPKSAVINTYGPTESTVAVTDVVITDDMLEQKELPIGKTRPGTKIIIIDENGNELTQGKAGEMLIIGDTVSPGYFEDDEKTKAVFGVNDKGERIYKTGDKGFYGKDRQLYISGRMDLQIKFHGYRIELGDIEQNLLAMDMIKGACVVTKKRDGKIQQIAAFLVCEGIEGSFADRKMIRNFLKEKLPEYMVPKKLVFVDSIPMTDNGKIDRKKMEASL